MTLNDRINDLFSENQPYFSASRCHLSLFSDEFLANFALISTKSDVVNGKFKPVQGKFSQLARISLDMRAKPTPSRKIVIASCDSDVAISSRTASFKGLLRCARNDGEFYGETGLFDSRQKPRDTATGAKQLACQCSIPFYYRLSGTAPGSAQPPSDSCDASASGGVKTKRA